MATKKKKDLWWYLNQQFGLPAIKRTFTKKTGIPTTKAGIERKLGSKIIDWILGILGIDKSSLNTTKKSTKTSSAKKTTTKKSGTTSTKKSTSTGTKSTSTSTKSTSTGTKTTSTGTKTTSTSTRKTTTTTTAKSRKKSSLMGDVEEPDMDAPEGEAPATE